MKAIKPEHSALLHMAERWALDAGCSLTVPLDPDRLRGNRDSYSQAKQCCALNLAHLLCELTGQTLPELAAHLRPQAPPTPANFCCVEGAPV